MLLLFAAVECAACSGREWRVEAPAVEPASGVKTDGTMRMMGRWGFAHACPVDGFILTAAHVVNPFSNTAGLTGLLVGYAWEDGYGNRGYVKGAGASLDRDVGVLTLESGVPVYYRHAEEAPAIGDLLYWVEYDYERKSTVFEQKSRRGELLRIVPGHLVLDREPAKGASGGCLLNANGEVVGLIVWGQPTKSQRVVAVAVAVYGEWWGR
jgi:hypothetical protein